MKPKYNTAKFRSQTLGASLVTSIVVCLSGSAFAADWAGDVSGDWNDNNNWVGDAGTGGSNAIINVVGTDASVPYTATISSNIVATPVDIMVGIWGGTGKLNHTAGTAATGGGNWAFVGREGGTGVYNLANTAVAGGGISGFAQGSGSINFNGRLYVGGWGNNTTNGTFNVNTTGTIAISSQLQIGNDQGTGVFNLESGTVTTGGEWVEIGNGVGSHGTLNMSGGSITKSGNDHFIVGANGGTGAANITGGTITVNNEIWVANNGGSNGTLNISGGTVTNSSWAAIGRAGAAHGYVNLSGGSWTKNDDGNFIVGDNSPGDLNISGTGALNANGEFWVGQAGGGVGIMTLTGSGTVATSGWMCVGREGGTGTVSMSGGTWTHSGSTSFIVGNSGAGSGTMTQSGGTVEVLSGETWIGENGTGTYTLNGTGLFKAGIFQAARNGGSNGTVNLDGGTLRAARITGGGGADHFHFNGTQIVATTSEANFINNIDGGEAFVDPGGLKIDSNGFTLIAPQALNGTGGLVKSGAGTLTLSAANSYSGGNTVNAGELVIRAASTGGGPLTLADSAALGVSQTTGGSQLVSSNVTFGTTPAGTTLNLNIGDVGGTNPSTSFIDVTGNLVLNGDVTVNVTGTKFDDTIMPLVSYNATNRSGAGVFNLANLPNGVVATLVDDPNYGGPNVGLVYLDITSVALPEWDGTNEVLVSTFGDTVDTSFDITVADATGIVVGQEVRGPGIPTGAVVTVITGLTITLDMATTATAIGVDFDFVATAGTNEGLWDTTTQNWIDQVTTLSSVYADPNPVLFSDLATGPTAVTLNSTVSPSEVVFNNSTLVYSLSGTGKVSGTATFTKSGTAALTVSTANDYTGVTTLAGGNTTVATLTDGGLASPLGAATSAASNLVLSGGTLDYTGATVSINRGFTTGGQDGAISVPGGADLTMTGPVVGGLLSSFNKKGDGSLILTNTSVSLGASGQVNEVLAGTLKLIGPGQTVSIPGELWVGSVPAAAGHLVLDGTSLTVGGWFTLGRGNGDTGLLSTITATDSTIVSGAFSTGYDNNLPTNNSDQTVTLLNTNWTNNGATVLAERQNSLTNMTLSGTSVFTANSQFQMATNGTAEAHFVIQDNAGLVHTNNWFSIGNDGVGTMTVKDSGTINSSGDFNVGDVASANGTLNIQDSGAVTSTGTVFIGKNGTTGTINMIGASTMSSPDTNVGGNGSSHGYLNIAGTSVYTSGGRLQVGPGGGSIGEVLIEGSGSMTVNSYVSVGFNGGGTMTVKNNGTFSNTDDFSVNESGDVPAIVNVQDDATLSAVRTIFVGRNTGRVGTLNVTGNADVNQTDAGYSFIVGPAGTGTLNINGATAMVSVASNGGVTITNNATGTGTVNLGNGTPGGTLLTKKVSDGGGASTFNFDGGVLKAASGADLNFMSGLDTVDVKPGGAYIDSNGQTIAIGQALGDGGGDVHKQGAGTLRLNAANGYLGTTFVDAGTLGGTGSVSGPLMVAAAASVNPGASAGTFSADSADISGTYVCEIDGANGDQLAVAGVLTIVPGAVLDFSVLSAPASVSYVIATFNSRTGPDFLLQNVPAGFQVVYNATNITLEIIPTAYTTWAASFGINPLTDGAPGADKDSDGQSNSIEFALGGSPISGSDNARIYNLVADGSVDGDATSELLMTIAVRSGTPAFAGSPSPTATKDGATYTIQGSTTLGSFTTGVTPVAPVITGLPAVPSGYEYRTFSLDGSNGTPDKGFLRVQVDY